MILNESVVEVNTVVLTVKYVDKVSIVRLKWVEFIVSAVNGISVHDYNWLIEQTAILIKFD